MAASYNVSGLTVSTTLSASVSKSDDNSLLTSSFGPSLSKSLVGKTGDANFDTSDVIVLYGSIGTSASVDIDLSAVAGFWGESLFTSVSSSSKIKAIGLYNDSTAATDAHILMGPKDAGTGFFGPLSGTLPRQRVDVGHPPILWVRQGGFADDLTTNKNLRLTNNSSTQTAAYRLLISGK